MKISFLKKTVYLSFLLGFLSFGTIYGQEQSQTFTLKNSKLKVNVTVNRDGYLTGNSIMARSNWAQQYGKRPFGVASNGGFKMKFMWTAWSAPGKSRNGEDLLTLTQQNFRFTGEKQKTLNSGAKQLILMFEGTNTPLELRFIYQVGENQFYARKKIEIRMGDNSSYTGKPYLRRMSPVYAKLKTSGKIIKPGGFGQPVAMRIKSDPKTGLFLGMEFPTAQNKLVKDGNALIIESGDYYGKQIGSQWFSSNWVVIGLTPQPMIKQWFMKYVDAMRAQPVHPYLLYNSWYDLRNPSLVHSQKYVMNQKNALRIIRLLHEHLTQKHGITLDAFVLDDGWDVYQSNWKISDKRFPNGFKPLVKQLNKTNTDLGIWIGPIGGYSHRNLRVSWMKDHGYEVIPGTNELCLAGKNYHQLLMKRVTNFTKSRGVGYYKWDGIAFSCSDPSHGHPVGVYSRRAIMDSVIALSQAVWNENPDAFLNITSGTWLSPWWLKYANTIWMQGGDYGYANVPSISRRDQAITYRDWGLYNDFVIKDSWVPIANLMTHGIIKGRLQKLGAKEPLDKFTNNAVLYFSRGISMWELYVSPDLLTDQQWKVLAKSIKWAKDRFDILKHTVMVGGNPAKGEPYGYAHFKGDRGIITVRNPRMKAQRLTVTINKWLGLDGNVDSLVVERVYPRKKISPVLVSSGSKLTFDLKGYETAVYEIFPLDEAQRPLLAGAAFTASETNDGYKIKVLKVDEKSGGAHFLNPEKFPNVRMNNQQMEAGEVLLNASSSQPVVQESMVEQSNSNHLVLNVDVDPSMSHTTFAVLLQNQSDGRHSAKQNPSVVIKVDGQKQSIKKQAISGKWGWYKVPITPGSHTVSISLKQTKDQKNWSGLASLWLIGNQHVDTRTLTVKGDIKQPPFPPVMQPKGTVKRQLKLGEFNVGISSK